MAGVGSMVLRLTHNDSINLIKMQKSSKQVEAVAAKDEIEPPSF